MIVKRLEGRLLCPDLTVVSLVSTKGGISLEVVARERNVDRTLMLSLPSCLLLLSLPTEASQQISVVCSRAVNGRTYYRRLPVDTEALVSFGTGKVR